MTVPNDTQTIDAAALRARLAEMAQRARDEMAPAGLRERIETALRARNSNDIVRVEVRRYDVAQWRASAYVGEPIGEDLHARPQATEAEALATLARAVGLNPDGTDPRAEVARLRALLEVAQTSLAAATSGRRVTACDEIERLQRERDALRDAAREYLDARHRGLVELLAYLDADPADAAARDAASACEARVTATRTRLAALVGDDATMRRDLPAVAVVSCPACGYGCTADLGDGGYVLRPHSRRETARVGLGGIVWCDGGTVRVR